MSNRERTCAEPGRWLTAFPGRVHTAPVLCALLAAMLGCGAAREPTSPGSSVAAPGFSLLHAEGPRIVNAAGEVVRLRGLNLGGWLTSP